MFRINRKMIARGALTGLKTSWELAKVVVPTTMLVAIFKESGLLDSVAGFFAPYMGLFGLSGAAALVLFSGYLINIYVAAGSVLALDLAPSEIAILAVMLTFCHSLLIELPISKKAGGRLGYIFLIRLGFSLGTGILMGAISS